jgi:hypothetical protein
MNELQKKNIVYEAMKKSRLFNMEKIEIYYNKNEMLCIKDFTYTVFINGIAILDHINYYKKTLTLDILRPDYLIHDQMILNL